MSTEIKRCSCCGRTHDLASWERCRLDGPQAARRTVSLEVRTCSCGGTMGLKESVLAAARAASTSTRSAA